MGVILQKDEVKAMVQRRQEASNEPPRAVGAALMAPIEVDDVTRREFLVGASGLLLLPVGCGGEGDKAGGGETSAGETRTVGHFLGQAEVPLSPEGVVVLDSSALETALSVGAEPVGAPRPGSLPEHLRDRVPEGTEGIGDDYAPNLESVALLEPDLILGNEFSAEETYDELGRIAPTVVAEFGETSGNWKRLHAKYAEALGRREEGARVMDDYRARAGELADAMGHPEETVVSVVRVSEEYFRVDHRDLFNGTILADVGFSRPPSQDREGEGGVTDLSLERVELAEGDVLFVYATGEEDRDFLSRLMEDPLWSRLDVVRRGRVHVVGEHWIGTGPVSADFVLDDLFEHLADRR